MSSIARFALCLVMAGALCSMAETGMCLVVCFPARPGAEDFIDGDIRRIDMVNNVPRTPTAAIGFGCFPRFSPDGDRFAYIHKDTVKIASINGNIVRWWRASAYPDSNNHLSWTNTGLYIGAYGRFIKFDTLGVKLWEKRFPDCNWGFVSRNDSMGGGVHLCCYPLIYNMMAGTTTNAVVDKGGCSACPSPSGHMLSNNLWSPDPHRNWRVLDKLGNELYYFTLGPSLGLDDTYHSNVLTWSGNGENWMVMPVGQDNGESQMTKNTSPWIFNVITHEKYEFSHRTTDHWQPHDYYSGKVPPSSSAELQLSSPALDFTADSGGPNPTAKSFNAFTAVDTLRGLTATKKQSWLTVAASGAKGTSILITASAGIAGLRPGTYRDTIAVTTANAGSAVCAVTLVVRAATVAAVLDSMSVTPANITISADASAAFLATAYDQLGRRLTGAAFTWSATTGGTINGRGVYTAGPVVDGPQRVMVAAQKGGVTLRDTALLVIARKGTLWKRINCGSNAYDVPGWERDDAYVAGGADFVNPGSVDTAGVCAAAPPQVYKSMRRQSPHSYAFTSLNPGAYTVRLHMADTALQMVRLMSYDIQGVNVLRDFDVRTLAGAANKALVLDFATDVQSDGALRLDCSAPSGDVLEAGLEIIESFRYPIMLLSPAGGEKFAVGDKMMIAWRADLSQTSDVMVYLSVRGGQGWNPLTTGYGINPVDTANWEKFSWTIPDSIPVTGGKISTISTQCRIKLTRYGLGDATAISDSNFTIAAKAPVAGGMQDRISRPFLQAYASTEGLRANIGAQGPYRVEVLTPAGTIIASREGRSPLIIINQQFAPGAYLLRVHAGARSGIWRVMVVDTHP